MTKKIISQWIASYEGHSCISLLHAIRNTHIY
ncbi:hypothetical protein [Rummeliibacillus suwonensis]